MVNPAPHGTDTVQSSLSYTLGSNIENLTLIGSDAIDGTGNTLVNALVGNAADNKLNGGTGADSLAGGAGNDTYTVDNIGDTVIENADAGTDTVLSGVTFTLAAHVENLTLTGSGSINGTGNDLANVLIGNTGVNSLAGGDGDDTYIVQNATDAVSEQANQGNDTVQSSVTYSLGADVENLTLTGTAALNGTGNNLSNTLLGNTAANKLDGGSGIDSLAGGGGNDTYVVDEAGDTITENADEGTDTVQSTASDYALSANVENLTLTGTAAINGTGNALDNVLTGNTGINVLAGGDGNDTYIVQNTTDVVTEAANEGTDTVQSSATFILGSDVENLTLTGSTAINGTGNGLANVLTGNSGQNTLTGGDGDDTYVVQNTNDSVVEQAGKGVDTVLSSVTFTLATDVENLTLTGTGAINASGNGLANILIGNAGNNTLNGGTGADSLSGGAGNDTYVVDEIGDTVTEAAGEGNDTVQSAITYALGNDVENLTLTGSAAVNGTGNSLNNTLTGNSGVNTLAGGDGNDTYVVQNTTDVVSEDANQGTDTVQSSVAYTLSANVENLTLTGSSAIAGTGNALDNVLAGNTGANTLTGGDGNDTYIVQNTNDVVSEASGEGIDTVQSTVTYTLAVNVENLSLTGSSAINGTGNAAANMVAGNTGANTLNGGGGNDTLSGGAGNDTLIGGDGADMYLFGRGDKLDTIQNADTDGGIDKLSFLSGIATDQLWFVQNGNDLDVSIIGTADSVKVQGWYSSSANMVDRIEVADGRYLGTSDVEALRSAMASFNPPPLGQTTLDANTAQALAPTLAASWHAA